MATSRSPAVVALVAALLVGCSPEVTDDATDPTSDPVLEGSEADAPPQGSESEEPGGVPPLLDGEDGIDHWDETRVELGDGALTIEAKVADTGARRQQGLMRVPDLPDGVGMLFVFDGPRTGGFWMKDTLVPLDIAYLADGEVAAILQMDPCEADPCPTFDAGVTYDAALEVRQGLFAEAGVEEGDPVTWSDPVPAR